MFTIAYLAFTGCDIPIVPSSQQMKYGSYVKNKSATEQTIYLEVVEQSVVSTTGKSISVHLRKTGILNGFSSEESI